MGEFKFLDSIKDISKRMDLYEISVLKFEEYVYPKHILLIGGFCFLCYVAWSSDNPVGACTTFNNIDESYTITFKYNFPLSDETFKKLGADKSWISDDLEYPRRYAIDYIGKLNAINWDWKRNHCINF